jgi:hypothetical protein
VAEEEEVITFYGATDGTSTKGTFRLDSDVLHGPVDFIRPDKGMRVRIWARWIAGKPCYVYVEQTEDVTATPEPTYKKVAAFYLSSEGELHEDERRAVELFSRDGKQAFRLTWEQSTAGVTHVAIKVGFKYEGT